MESAEQVSAASGTGTDSVTEYKKMTHIESAVANDTSAGLVPIRTPPPAPRSPITVGDFGKKDPKRTLKFRLTRIKPTSLRSGQAAFRPDSLSAR